MATRVRPDLNTLSLDIGGTGLKATVLDRAGKMLTDRARIKTTYPMTPTRMVEQLTLLAKPLPAFDRISVGFPGVVRAGIVRSAFKFTTKSGAGSAVDPKLVKAWDQFDLAGALARALGKPTRVINDADLQGLDVASGTGVEVVVTLGTGFGSAVLQDGRLGPHLELSHHPFRHGDDYDTQLGDAARKRLGDKKWNKRVQKAIAQLDELFNFDMLYLGGGNAHVVSGDLGPNVKLIDGNAGLRGGIRLWDQPGS